MSDWHPGRLPRGEGRVRLEEHGRRAEIVLDSPSARNALSPGMMADLGEIVARLERWEGGAVLLRGEGDAAFCAGGHLHSVQAHLLEAGGGAGMCAWMTGVLNRLASLPAVVMAAVEGAALGGGAELITACDLVVAGRGARLGFVQAALGVSPGWGGGARLVRRVGARNAMRLLAFARPISAEEAESVGLVDRAVGQGEALQEARRWLAELESVPPEALRAAVLIARGAPAELEEALFAELWGGPAHRAALERHFRGRA